MTGRLLWGKKIQAGYFQSSWYDHTRYIVPVVGTVDTHKIWQALAKHYPQKFTKFGGFTTVESVKEVPGVQSTVEVEMAYHIGD